VKSVFRTIAIALIVASPSFAQMPRHHAALKAVTHQTITPSSGEYGAAYGE